MSSLGAVKFNETDRLLNIKYNKLNADFAHLHVIRVPEGSTIMHVDDFMRGKASSGHGIHC